MKEEIDPRWPQTWEEIFADVPTAPGTEAQQQRHKQLREQDDMTEEEEAELNELFYAIYPQLKPRLVVRECEMKKPLSFCRACGTPLSHEYECCCQHAKQLIRKMQRYWITQGFHLRDIKPDGTLVKDMAQKSGRKQVTLNALLYADRTDFQLCPGDESVAADITVAELKEIVVAVNASNEQIRGLYQDLLHAEARIGTLEFFARRERSLRE